MKPAFLIMIATCFLVVFSLHGVLAAISLGSVTGARKAEAFPGDTIVFEVFLFNIHQPSDLEVDMSMQGPEGWNIYPESDRIGVKYYPPGGCVSENDYVCLNTGLGYVMARSVSLTVNVPWSVETGVYQVRAISLVRGNSSDMAIQQSRHYDFQVKVSDGNGQWEGDDDNAINAGNVGNDAAVNDPEADAGSVDTDGSDATDNEQLDLKEPNGNESLTGSDEIGLGSDSITGALTTETIGLMSYAIIIVLILFVSWRIYKR
jgi:hypothetical protein